MSADFLKYAAGNSASTTGASSITNTDTSLPLVSDTNFAAKSGEGQVIVDEGAATEELAYATGASGGALTIPLVNRGLEGGSAQAHASGATVKGILSAGMWNNVIDALINLVLKTTGAVDTTKVVTPTGTQTLTNKTLTSPVIRSWDGWEDANETWTYASATTINVPTGAASKYQKGDKIKLTQTTVKYFFVTIVANTLLTVVGDGAVVVTNAAISANYYSHVENPIGFPGWFSWTPTEGASGSMTYTITSLDVSKFTIKGATVYCEFGCRGTTGGSASTTLTITPPVIPTSQLSIIGGGAMCYDSGTVAGVWWSASNVIMFNKYDSSNWGAGTTKDIKTNFFYQI